MQSRQLVGMKCARCHKTVASVVDGVFCATCGNPVHLKCRRPCDDPAPEGECAECGGDVRNPVAVEVQTLRDQRPGTGDTRLACPNCHSDRGFRPYEGQSDNAPNVIYFLFLGPLLYILIFGVGPLGLGRLQCLDCDYIFRPRNRAREYGCLIVLALLLTGALAWLLFSPG
jgi:hypothetical protein